MDAKYAKDKYNLEWGKTTKEDILRRMYNQKSLNDLNENEFNKMLKDLIWFYYIYFINIEFFVKICYNLNMDYRLSLAETVTDNQI